MINLAGRLLEKNGKNSIVYGMEMSVGDSTILLYLLMPVILEPVDKRLLCSHPMSQCSTMSGHRHSGGAIPDMGLL